MKLEDVKQIKQTTSEREVNEALKEGFIILRIFQSKIKSEIVEQLMPVYILGKGN